MSAASRRGERTFTPLTAATPRIGALDTNASRTLPPQPRTCAPGDGCAIGLLQHLPAPAIGAKDLDPVGAAIARDQIKRRGCPSTPPKASRDREPRRRSAAGRSRGSTAHSLQLGRLVFRATAQGEMAGDSGGPHLRRLGVGGDAESRRDPGNPSDGCEAVALSPDPLGIMAHDPRAQASSAGGTGKSMHWRLGLRGWLRGGAPLTANLAAMANRNARHDRVDRRRVGPAAWADGALTSSADRI